ncbi:hypothetical protein [Conexibacter woesei]|uniref:hypothetical protein n=1 Tax=Conexibacter woesei TaxID=191495 RepID=UPI0004024665|nr:hypothetical protein [Conexibacter woesei]
MAARDKYQTLTLADLFAARDAYQVHLARLPNVVGTALGLYLEREDELAEGLTPHERRARPATGREPRTLANSAPGPTSWPCVLVFVSAWLTPRQIREAPDAMVPRELYLPDGRTVPTCVVFTPPVAGPPDEHATLSYPSALIGGGYVCESFVQGQIRTGTIGCLVTDGDVVSALTNRHVAGEAGRRLHTEVGGSEVPIGTSSGTAVGRVPLGAVYPGLGGDRVELAVDAGLIQLDDINNATAQVFGVGTLGAVVDVGGAESLSLELIGQDVRAFGGASGALTGQVLALSYRYRSLAGTDYVADVLIGPREGGELPTRPGDSGTLWVADGPPLQADPQARPRPIALQWGGHRFGTGARRESPYALATFLSTALSQLQVDVLADFNADHDTYWGTTGHYTIGALACDLVRPAGWKSYMVANRTNIGFEIADIEDGRYLDLETQRHFIPLADVPDRVWKHPVFDPTAKRGREGPNHYADVDQPLPGAAPTETLLSNYLADPATLTPAAWNAFYERLDPVPHTDRRGMLPFRVAQLYKEAVAALRSGDVLHGFCALGVMAHYVGDASQPLHGSQFADGRPDDRHRHVHAGYEDDMMDRHRTQLRDGLAVTLKRARLPALVKGHQAAAHAAMDLMARTAAAIPPLSICDAWQAPGATPQTLWDQFGDATIACVADACVTLALLWSSAFAESGARAPAAAALDPRDITALVVQDAFAESYTLPLFLDAAIW